MTRNGFNSEKEEAVYNWLVENGSEKVAVEVTNILNSNQIDDLYDGLVHDFEIDEEDENEDEDDE